MSSIILQLKSTVSETPTFSVNFTGHVTKQSRSHTQQAAVRSVYCIARPQTLCLASHGDTELMLPVLVSLSDLKATARITNDPAVQDRDNFLMYDFQ